MSGHSSMPVRYRACSSLLLSMCVSYVTLRPKLRSGVKSWPFSRQVAEIPLAPPAGDCIASL